MKKKHTLVFFIGFVCVLASYARLSDEYPQLNEIQAWKIKGSIGIKHNNRTQMASLNWIQDGIKNYNITLSGPLSMGATRIQGRPGHVLLWKSSKEKYIASTPEQLMSSRLGWQIPMSNMYYWSRGLPAPGIPAKTSYDNAHHLRYLSQQGWRLQYLEYTQVGGVDLPKKMIMIYPNLAIKLVIKEWQI